jgi:hypothetical protein
VHDCGDLAGRSRVTYGGRTYTLIDPAPGIGASTTPGTNNLVWYDVGAAAAWPAWSAAATYYPGGAFLVGTPSSGNVIVGCYVEGPQICHMNANDVSLFNGGRWTSYSNSINNNPGTGRKVHCHTGFTYYAALDGALSGHPFGAYFQATIGNETGIMVKGECPNYSAYRLRFGGEFATMNWDALDSSQSWYYTSPQTTYQLGTGVNQPYANIFTSFAIGANLSVARRVTIDSAAPASGNHAQGEIVFNSGAAAGGKVGWVCTAGGSPGTWKAFGAIDP